tara:strand:- start:617 stop:1003 length:387 start_codon:yes stop_codon:yes gene_type:complete
MRYVLFLLFFFLISQVHSQESPEMKVYVKNNNMKKGYRILKTKFSDSLIFKKNFKDSDYTLDFVLRHFYATAIDLGCDKNELISMNDKVFKLKSETVENIIDEVISLIGNMYYGRKEDENFNNMLKRN